MISTWAFLYCLLFLAGVMIFAAAFWPYWERSGLRRDIHRASTRIRRRKPAPLNHPGHRRAPRIQFTEPEVDAKFAAIIKADRAARRIPRQRNSNEENQ